MKKPSFAAAYAIFFPHSFSMKQLLRYLAAPLLGATLLAACARQEPTPRLAPAINISQDATAPGFPEGFETGTKTAYTTGSVTLGSGSWTLNDALLGNTTADAHTGSQS
jgi:hypothetical protein